MVCSEARITPHIDLTLFNAAALATSGALTPDVHGAKTNALTLHAPAHMYFGYFPIGCWRFPGDKFPVWRRRRAMPRAGGGVSPATARLTGLIPDQALPRQPPPFYGRSSPFNNWVPTWTSPNGAEPVVFSHRLIRMKPTTNQRRCEFSDTAGSDSASHSTKTE